MPLSSCLRHDDLLSRSISGHVALHTRAHARIRIRRVAHDRCAFVRSKGDIITSFRATPSFSLARSIVVPSSLPTYLYDRAEQPRGRIVGLAALDGAADARVLDKEGAHHDPARDEVADEKAEVVIDLGRRERDEERERA